MAYLFQSVGSYDQHSHTSTSPIQGGQPAGVVAGDLLVIHAALRNNAYTLATPTNWTQLSPNVNDTYNYLFGRIATGDALDNFPALVWSNGATAVQAFGQMARFSGNQASITNIVHASVDQSGTGAGASGNDIQYNALTITAANTLVIARGMHNKTSTSNGATLNAIAGFTEIQQVNPNGSVFSLYWGYQIQTTATNLSSVVQTRNGTVENLQQNSLFISLKAAAVASVANKAYLMNVQTINNG